MTVTVDCRMIDASGVGTYLRGILPFFLQSGNNFLLLGDARRLSCYTQYKNAEIIHYNKKSFSLNELFFFPSELKKTINRADLFFSPFFNIPAGIDIPVFTTIHDIIFPDMPQLYSKAGLAVRMRFLGRAHKKSKKIFTVSEFSKSRIEYHLGKSKPVIVAHPAVQPSFLEYMAKTINIKKKKTVVFLGNIKKNKGLACLLDAFALAKKEGLGHRLIIIGEKEKFRSSDSSLLKEINFLDDDAFTFTGHVSSEKLMEYLSEASLLVQPSLYEGFGLPPLEAMVLGTGALISDIPVFREIYGGYPVTFFRCGDCAELKEKMLSLLSGEPPVINLPDDLLSKYTFEKTASVIMRELN
ncbi:MAG: glycosyltransferase family 4 protein [Treponema sp.]|nr:glycosyltransferase family 4 protein [Treponema sp.]